MNIEGFKHAMRAAHEKLENDTGKAFSVYQATVYEAWENFSGDESDSAMCIPADSAPVPEYRNRH